MNQRLTSLRSAFAQRGASRLAAAALLAAVLGAGGMNAALAAPADAAGAPGGASSASASGGAATGAATGLASYSAGGKIAVKPGQSLNDLAVAITQSHDKATLARASRALFDANPNAFMSHDPDRLRLGATLTVPPLDATGAPVASAPEAAASAPAEAAASMPAAIGGASGAAQANAAAVGAAGTANSAVNNTANNAANAANAASSASVQTTPAATSTVAASAAAASAPAETSAAASGAASSAQKASGASAASSAQTYSGAIHPASGAEGASSAQPRQVSSLQQLLALKNRVLMELQKHGIGGTPAANSAAATTGGAAAAAGASTATAGTGHGAASQTTPSNGGLSQATLSVAAAIGAALVVLLTAFRMNRRKRANAAAAERAAAAEAAAQDTSVDPDEEESARVELSSSHANPSHNEAVQHAAAQAEAEREAAEGESAQREMAERQAAERDAEMRRAASEQAEVERTARPEATTEQAEQTEQAEAEAEAEAEADGMIAEREAAEHAVSPHDAAHDAEEPEVLHDVYQANSASAHEEPEPLPPANHESLGGATTAASLAAAAELGADALPRTPLEEAAPQARTRHEQPRTLQWDDEPSDDPLAEPPEPPEPSALPLGLAASSLAALDHHEGTAPDFDVSHEPIEPGLIFPLGTALGDFPAPPPLSEFPRDALDAFSSLDMPLPPRIESLDDELFGQAPLATQPVASPESTARQALKPYDPDNAPHIADEIAAGTAGHAAVAGLGANVSSALGSAPGTFGGAGFGALKLDFDLELPQGPSQPLPAFTPEEMGRIARNKLDLAAEYMELGDLAGARTLINEVIEANDPATRTEARALLSTLAPLS